LKYLKKFPFKPSIIILSGAGAHLYLLLNEPAEKSDIEAVEDVNRRIAHALGGDQNATEAARVLRVPGTLNHKYSPPRQVKLHRINDFHYELDDFSDLPQPPANSPSSNRSSVTLKPVEHGNRNVTLARIAGKYITRGLASDEVLDLCLGWNCRCPEPQSIEDVITTVNSIIKTDRRRRSIINANKRGNIAEVFKAWEMAAIEELRKTIQDFEASAMILDPLLELQSTLDILMIGNEADRVGVYRRWKARGNRF